MALSSLTYVSRGAGPYPLAGLDYLDPAHLAATVNGVPASATVDTRSNTLTLAAAAAAGAAVVIFRTTPRKREERVAQFLNLPNGQAGLTAALLDTDYRQNMLLSGEALDLVQGADEMLNSMTLSGGHWDGQSHRIVSLVGGSNPTDAIIKSQLDTMTAGAILLPSVSGADNDDGLFVASGAWAKRTPTQGRTHLALGTAATLNVGTGANNVCQLDGNARYPTADGRNIDLTNHAIQTEINKRARATVVKFTRVTQPGNGVDPTPASWAQSASTRFGFSGSTWTNRIELNNSSDVDGNFSPGRVDLSSGTWRIRMVIKARQTSAAGNNIRFGVTNNDDTSGQTVYLDTGVHRIIRQFSGSQNYYWIHQDELIIANASAFTLVFRWALTTTAANNDADLSLFFHKISTSVLS